MNNKCEHCGADWSKFDYDDIENEPPCHCDISPPLGYRDISPKRIATSTVIDRNPIECRSRFHGKCVVETLGDGSKRHINPDTGAIN